MQKRDKTEILLIVLTVLVNLAFGFAIILQILDSFA